jgi:hypothetical protein
MKALDGYLDRRVRDGGFDYQTSMALSKDLNVTDYQQFKVQQAGRERMTVAQNYFALACPIMPIGFLGAFMFLEKLGGLYQPEPEQEKIVAQRQEELTRALYVTAMREKLEADKKKKGYMNSMPDEIIMRAGEKKQPKKNKDTAMMLSGRTSDRISGPPVLSKEQRDVGKVVKKKMAMQSMLEQHSKNQDYSAVCRVSSKIELLDKALKRMGC